MRKSLGGLISKLRSSCRYLGRDLPQEFMLFTAPGTDPLYEALRTSKHPRTIEARERFVQLCERGHPYLDLDLPNRVRHQFHQAFWELYVAVALLESDHSLVPRVHRTPRTAGPDLLSAAPSLWVEVIAVTRGVGPDRVPDHEYGVVRSVPDEQIILRLTSAILEKNRVRKRYVERGWMRASDPYVVAVNAGDVPDGGQELPLPRIIRAVFPFGHMVARLSLDSHEIVDTYHQHRPEIAKASGARVSTMLFESDVCAGISGILYSTVDVANYPDRLLNGLTFVHNPMATSPLPTGYPDGIQKYWREGDRLRFDQTS